MEVMHVSGRSVLLEKIEPLKPEDRKDIEALLTERWGSPRIVTRGRLHEAASLPGYQFREEGRLAGLVTLSIECGECEIVSLDSLLPGRGIGQALLEAAETHARAQGCRRLWLVTTNDNLPAVAFYQRKGFRIVAVHRDAVTRARELKPELAETGRNGIPIRDELEMEKVLESVWQNS